MKLVLLIPLSLLVISDFRSREVCLWHLLLFGSMQIAFAVAGYGMAEAGKNILCNTLLCLAVCLFCIAWFMFRGKRVKKMTGLGDLIFIWFLTPVFTYCEFPVFITVSFTVTLTAWVMVYFAGKATRDIPLISGMGVCYAFFLTYSFFYPYD